MPAMYIWISICFFRMPRKSGVFSVYQPVYKVVYHVYTKEGYRAMSGYVAGCRANPLKH